MKEVTGDNFREEVMDSEVPVLVDFWAPWCGPCKMITSILEEISEKYGEQVKFCKVNVDDVSMSDIPKDFSVSAVPTLIMVKNGTILNKEVGLKTKEAIDLLIEEAL